jgi:hypothetical protein
MDAREYADYRRLVAHFSNRLFESDAIARGGSVRELITTIVALLAAAGIVLGYFLGLTVSRHAGMSERMMEALRWGNREFLVSISMVFTAALAIVSWDSVFPDRTDCVFLSQMPLRMRTVMGAKLTTLIGAFVVAFVAANAFTGIMFPVGSAAPGKMALTIAAHITAVFAASAFVFFTFLALQALLIHVLPYRLVKRVSAWMQLGALFTILFGFFLIPPISAPGVLASPANHRLVSLIPSFWFVGLYQTMLGTADPVVRWLAWRAAIAVVLSVSIALAGYLAGYSRHVRKTIEESGAIAEIRKPRLVWAKRLLDRSLLSNPRQRAVFWYAWRTMVRNRTPRLMLAAYASVGFVYVSNGLASALKTMGHHAPGHLEPNGALGAFPLILPFFLLLGMRVLFTFPVELGANWLFRLVDEEGDPVSALCAVRKLMIVAGIVPVCIASLPMYGLLWGWRIAFWHVLLALLIALAILQMLTTGFYKIPFTCSFMPGNANLKATFTIYAVGFLIISFITIKLELWLLLDTVRTVKGVAFFAVLLAWASWRRRSDEEGPAARLVYEERANWQLNTLELT